MATGIPGKNKHKDMNASKGTFCLEYEGKTPIAEIFSTPITELHRILSLEKQPKNRLIYGENLRVIRTLLNDKDVVGKVSLIYIDPPYATGSGFESRKQQNAYQDFLGGAAYLEFLRQRLILLRELLSPSGSIYVHLDDNMAFPVALLGLVDKMYSKIQSRWRGSGTNHKDTKNTKSAHSYIS